jgi:hypothetical protein
MTRVTGFALFASGLSLVLSGCLAPQPKRGSALVPSQGTPMAEFTFVDEKGQPHNVGELRGDFTVLAFTKCSGSQHQPVSKWLAELVNGHQKPGVAQSVGVDIHWSDEGCSQNDGCHLVAKNPSLFSICDAKGVVRHMYGATGSGLVVIVGPDGRIVDRDTVDHLDAVRERFRGIFNDYAAKEQKRLLPSF